MKPFRSIHEIGALYERWGQDPYDEEISQWSHAVQTAALAREEGAPEPWIAAALLHDVGHLLHLAEGGSPESAEGIDRGHEKRGACALSRLFPADVTGPIALHVQAKRWRCTKAPSCHDALSPASQRSLIVQGGLLTAQEVQRFERNPHFPGAVRLRAWDDHGKESRATLPPFTAYRTLLEHVRR